MTVSKIGWTDYTINPGIYSAPGRDGGRTCQIDCRMNYGNVGGPLLNMQGELIGITVKVRAREAASLGQNSGVAFALPMSPMST